MGQVIVTGELIIKTPNVPNFIEVNGVYTSISNLTEAQLKIVANAWQEDLVSKAKRKRDRKDD